MSDEPIDGKQLQRDSDELRLAMANAIGAWQFVEEQLFEIFHLAAIPDRRKMAAQVFHGAINFEVKLRLTTAALEMLLRGDPLLETWIKNNGNGGLNHKLKKKAGRRNSYAHGNVASIIINKTLVPHVIPPPSWAHASIFQFSSKARTLKDAKDDFKSFLGLYEKLKAFADQLRARQASPGTHPLQGSGKVLAILQDTPKPK